MNWGPECDFSFQDLYKAAFKKEATKTFQTKFAKLPQEKRNELVKLWAEKAGWGTKEKMGNDNLVYTAFCPLWRKNEHN